MFSLEKDRVPKLGDDEKLVDDVLQLKEKGKFVDKLVVGRGQKYVLMLKNIKNEPLKKLPDLVEKALDVRQSKVAYSIFNEWAQQAKEGAKIERNPKILAN